MVRKNIKVPEDLFMALREDKDDQQSWPHYLEEQCLHDATDEMPPGFLKLQEATEQQLEEIKARMEDASNAAKEAANAAQSAEKTVEEMR
jgi:ElaB/YqjD/DUF883 family membrane-anchored ribosome-binding protein